MSAVKNKKASGGLAKFLIERASKNDVIANYFYWYLVVECEGSATTTNASSVKVDGAANASGNVDTDVAAAAAVVGGGNVTGKMQASFFCGVICFNADKL